MINYFAAEKLIIERIKQKIDIPDNAILSSSFFDAKKAQIADFTIQVIYTDDLVDSGKRNFGGIAQGSSQEWLVVIGIRDVSDASGVTAREKSGDKIIGLIESLQGHRLSPDHGMMTRETAPFRPSYSNGYLYVPFAFRTQIIITGDT